MLSAFQRKAARKRNKSLLGRGVVVGTTAAAIALFAFFLSAEGRVPCRRCNVLLISIDTLRADHTSLYGYPRRTTPFLESLAAESVVFRHFYQNGGGTLPSHMTLMTSLRPAAHGVDVTTGRTLPPSVRTLAELMRAHGFRTAAFVDAGWLKGRFGFMQGFDLYDDSGGRFTEILPKVRRWLVRNVDVRFFLFVHTYDVHSEWERLPYECPGGFHWYYARKDQVRFDGCRNGLCASRLLSATNRAIRRGELRATDRFNPAEIAFISSLYDGCIRYVDLRLRDLFDQLRRLRLYDRTIILLLSDHGEEFSEHGLFLHSQQGYEEIAHVPLLIKLPHSKWGGRSVEGLAAMVDVMPTVLDLVGVPRPEGLEGTSLVPFMRTGNSTRREVFIGSVIRTRRWKYFSETGKLVDLASDRHERRDFSKENPEIARRLSARIQWVKALDNEVLARTTKNGSSKWKLTPDEEQELRALGYLP